MTQEMGVLFGPRYSPTPPVQRGDWPPPVDNSPGIDSRTFPQRLYHQVFDLGDVELRDTITHVSKMADLRLVNQQGLLVFIATSSLDVALRVNVVGSEFSNPADSQLYIGNVLGVMRGISATEQYAFTVPAYSNAFPFMGMQYKADGTPTKGAVRIKLICQMWTP